MNKDKEKIFFPLMVVLGFLIGIVLGYIFVGADIEYKCSESIVSCQNYINHNCVNRITEENIVNFNLTRVFDIGI